MTMLTLIVINAVLGAAVVYGIVVLLGFGIRTDRTPRRNVRFLPAENRRERRIAA